MKIVVAGGSGFIGKALLQSLTDKNHEVILLTRNPGKVKQGVSQKICFEKWDGKNEGSWTEVIHNADGIINLAGEGIAEKRWSAAQKEKIVQSRINATAAIVRAMGTAEKKPTFLINGSAIGYYGNVPEGKVDENALPGKGFLSETCQLWEAEAVKAKSLGVRVVCLRIGVVLERGGGALEKFLTPFRLFAGGPLGSGKQWLSWVHRDEIVQIIDFIIRHGEIEGPVNTTAPDPVIMKEFCHTLGEVMHRPSWMPVPGFVLKTLLGEMAEEMLLSGQRVVPQKLLHAGYSFQYPSLKEALRNIL